MKEFKIYREVAKLRDINMFYLDTKTQGQVILCLHGRWGRGETFSDFMKRYGGKYRVIAQDQRGHGFTSKPKTKYTSQEMGEDIIQLLDYLKIKNVILVGHSMGGAIAAYLAATYPEYINSLAILDESAAGTSNISKKELERIDYTNLEDYLTKDWPKYFDTLDNAKLFIKKFACSPLEYDYFMRSLIETVEGYKMMFSSQAMEANRIYKTPFFDILPKIKCLTLLIISAKENDDNEYKDYIKMQSLLKNCIAHEMSNPDHNVHLANKEEFYKYFDEFLMM